MAVAGTPSKHIRDSELAGLTSKAAGSPRGRSHLLLHAGHDDGVQRLLIAAEPGTYVRPHQHSAQWEMLVLIRGRLDVLELSEHGRVLARHALDADAPVVEIPISRWHTCAAMQAGTVVMEIKPGPYHPNEFAPWSAEEGTAAGVALQQRIEKAAVGDLLNA